MVGGKGVPKHAKCQYYSGGTKGRTKHLKQLWEENRARYNARANEKHTKDVQSESPTESKVKVDKRPRGRPRKNVSKSPNVVTSDNTDASTSTSQTAKANPAAMKDSPKKSTPQKINKIGNKTESTSTHQDLKISTTKLTTDCSTSTPRKVLNTYGRSVRKARIKGLGKLAGLIDAVGETPDLADELYSASAVRISQAISDVLCKLHGAGVWKDIAQTYDLEFIHDMEHKQVVLLGTWDSLTEARKEICKMCEAMPSTEHRSSSSESDNEDDTTSQNTMESQGHEEDKDVIAVTPIEIKPVAVAHDDALVETTIDADIENHGILTPNEASICPDPIESPKNSNNILDSEKRESMTDKGLSQSQNSNKSDVELLHSNHAKSQTPTSQPQECLPVESQRPKVQSEVSESQPSDPKLMHVVEVGPLSDAFLPPAGGDEETVQEKVKTNCKVESGAADIVELLSQVEGEQLQEVEDLAGVPDEQEVFLEVETAVPDENVRNRLPDGTRIHGKAYIIKNPTLATHRCDICGFASSLKGIYKHRIRKHSSVLYQCEVCGKTFGMRYDMRRHRIKHFDDDGNLTPEGLARLRSAHPEKEPFKLQTLELGFVGENKDSVVKDESAQAVSELVSEVTPLEEPVEECKIEEEADDGDKELPSEGTVEWNKIQLRPMTSLVTRNPSMATEQCELCEFKSTSGGLAKHKQRHHARISFKCPVCPKRFAVIHDMKRHLVCHDAKRMYTNPDLRKNAYCELCGFQGTDIIVFEHQKSVHKLDQQKCMYCVSTFQTLNQMKQHVQLRHPNRYSVWSKAGTMKRLPTDDQRLKCYVCNKEILASRFQQHIATHERQGFKCELCDYTAKWAWMVRRHHRVKHLNHRYICDFCGQSFVQDSALSTHIKTKHQDHGTFLCPECPSTFGAERYLKTHIQRMHRDTKKHFCDICGRRFFEKVRMKEHRQTHDSLQQREENKKFECSFCGRRFQKKTYLEQHENSHRGLKPYMCSVCGKCFSWISELHKHKHLHNPTKAFKCSVCSRGFHFRHQLNKHMITHTNSSPHMCLGCGKAFTLQTTLRRHRCRALLQRQILNATQSKDIAGNQILSSAPGLGLDNSGADHVDAKVVYMCAMCRVVFSNVDDVNKHIADKHGTQTFVMQEGETFQNQNAASHLTTTDVNQLVSAADITEIHVEQAASTEISDNLHVQTIDVGDMVGAPVIAENVNEQTDICELNAVVSAGEQIQVVEHFEVVNIDVNSDGKSLIPVDDVTVHEVAIDPGVTSEQHQMESAESSCYNETTVFGVVDGQQVEIIDGQQVEIIDSVADQQVEIVDSIVGHQLQTCISPDDHQSDYMTPAPEGYEIHVVESGSTSLNIENMASHQQVTTSGFDVLEASKYVDSENDQLEECINPGVGPQYVIVDSDDKLVTLDESQSEEVKAVSSSDVSHQTFVEDDENSAMVVMCDLDEVEMVVDDVSDEAAPHS